MNSSSDNTARWKMPAWLIVASLAAIVVGAVGLAVAFATSPREGWLWLIVNFVVFWGIAAGMLVWAAAFRTAQARWTSVVNRLGHSAVASAPFLLVVLIALVVGVRAYAPWVEHPVRGIETWLSVPAFAVREIVAALLFSIACLILVRRSLAADVASEVTDQAAHKLNVTAVVTVALFSVTATMIAWDFVMSLSPKWVSTMFSVYYFCTSAYAGMAMLIIMGTALRKPMGLEDRLKPHLFQDLGNLLLAFSLFNMGLFFAQYITIWYENMPEEVRFIILRYDKGIWPPMGWTAFVLGYAIPFILLQSRAIKLRPNVLSMVAALVLVGVAIERYVLIVPSLEPDKLLISPVGALSVLGFAGAFVLSMGWFLGRYSPVSAADEALRLTQDVTK
jgi:hypothetical protein